MTTKDNEEIIYAPIEIESADQLHALGATWDDCKTWRIGVTPVKVILVPADQETRDFLIKEMQNKYSKVSRRSRCVVPGKKKSWITCPESNHCTACPYHREGGNGAVETVSLDSLLEDGIEYGGTDVTAEQAEAACELELLIQILSEVSPRYVRLVRLLGAGYTIPEIAVKLDCSPKTVYRLIREIRRVAAERLSWQV